MKHEQKNDGLIITTIEPKNQESYLIEGNYNSGFEWPEPRALDKELLPVEACSAELLPYSIKDWALDVAERMQCPLDFVAVSLIVAMGSTLGAKIGIRPKRKDDWLEVPNVWGLVIGRAGAMKSPAMSDAMRPLRALEVEASKKNAIALEEFSRAFREYELRTKAAEKKATQALGKDLDADISQTVITPPKAPPQKRYIVNDVTMERLGEILADNPNGVLYERDEIVSLLTILQREEKANDRGFYLQAWNGTSHYDFDRIMRGRTTIERVCLSMLGGTQPAKIQPFIKDAVNGGKNDDGLMQRFSLAVWPDQSKIWQAIDRYPNKAAKESALEVFKRLDELVPIDANAEQDAFDKIPFLRFDDAAQLVFNEWHLKLENELRSGELHPALESHFSKYRKLIPSLALLFHLANGAIGSVSLEAINLAIKWGEYLKSHAYRLYSAATMPEKLAALAIWKKIKAGVIVDGFSVRSINQKGWTGLSDNEAVKVGVQLLLDHDLIRALPSEGYGRPTETFEINPKSENLK